MPEKIFVKGPKLLSLARSKARDLGVQGNGLGLEHVIWKVQEKEGNSICFRKKKACSELMCCWQASCGAEMVVR